MTAHGAGRPLPLAVTMGDPAGIGLEIALRAWHERSHRALPHFYLLGDPDALADRARALGLAVPVANITEPDHAAGTFSEALPVVAIPVAAKVEPGQPDPRNAQAVIGAIERASSTSLPAVQQPSSLALSRRQRLLRRGSPTQDTRNSWACSPSATSPAAASGPS